MTVTAPRGAECQASQEISPRTAAAGSRWAPLSHSVASAPVRGLGVRGVAGADARWGAAKPLVPEDRTVSVEPVTRKDGSRAWKSRWRENGRERARTFTLKRDADAWDREVARRKQLGPLAVQQLTTRGGPTLGQWIEQRWAVEHAALLADSTRDRYADVYSVHIAPWLDDVPIGHFSGPLLHGWQAQRIKAGVSPGTIRKARTLLSSVLRHAAESGAITANPLSVVRAPQPAPRDAVQPLSPATVERLRAAMLNPAPREIARSGAGRRARRRYQLPPPGTPRTWRRDALIVSILAYAGLRPGELRALPLGGFREKTILVEDGANPDGSTRPTKNRAAPDRAAALALAQDVREYKLAIGRHAEEVPHPASTTTATRGTRPPGRCGAPTAGPRPAAPSGWIRPEAV